MPQVFPQNHDPDGESSVTGLVHSVESCGTVDGPGIRFVLFLSGCSLRCRYCHNPDTSYVRRGRLRSAGDVLREIARYRDFLQAAGGGVTLSGGDPLFQPDFTGAVLKGCRKLGLHTCLDTSGHLGVNAGEEMLADTDLVLLDIKAWNPERYRSLTGGELRPTLEFAERLASLRKPVWLRYVLVPGVTDNLEEIEGLSRHAALLGNVERVDVLPFHQMGRFKWDELKLDYTLKGTPEASAKLAEQVRGIFRREGFPDCVYYPDFRALAPSTAANRIQISPLLIFRMKGPSPLSQIIPFRKFPAKHPALPARQCGGCRGHPGHNPSGSRGNSTGGCKGNG